MWLHLECVVMVVYVAEWTPLIMSFWSESTQCNHICCTRKIDVSCCIYCNLHFLYSNFVWVAWHQSVQWIFRGAWNLCKSIHFTSKINLKYKFHISPWFSHMFLWSTTKRQLFREVLELLQHVLAFDYHPTRIPVDSPRAAKKIAVFLRNFWFWCRSRRFGGAWTGKNLGFLENRQNNLPSLH